jgi:hypothetical protein
MRSTERFYSGLPMQTEQLSLREMKERAKALGCTKIRRDVEGAPILPLASWQGFSTESGSAFSHVPVWFRLEDNRVVVSKRGKPDACYILS